MANEATISASMKIKVGNLSYQSPQRQFRADVTDANGPTPGAMAVSQAGVDVDLSALDTPGFCEVSNIGASGTFDVGIWDPDTGKFYPFMEIAPGHQYVIRFSRNFSGEFGTGTGTTGPSTNALRLKSQSAVVCSGVVKAFEA